MSNVKPFLEPDLVYARIKELERIVKTLVTNAPYGPHISGDGSTGLQVTDPTGEVAGSVLLHTVTHGLRAQEVATTQGGLPIDANWHDLATVGPSVTVTPGNTGIVIVIASCNVATNTDSGGAGGCNLGVSIDGATPTLSDVGSFEFTGGPATASIVGTISIVRVYTLSANVAHTFKLKYQRLAGTGETWFNRSIVAIPY